MVGPAFVSKNISCETVIRTKEAMMVPTVV
jgi:hypothetical protein